MALVYDKALFDAQYSMPAWEHGVRNSPRIPRHHYNWFAMTQQTMRSPMRNNVSALLGGPGWASLTDVAIIGGAFGWTAETLLAFDPTMNLINVEVSPYILAEINTSEEADLRQYLIDDGFDPDNLPELMHPDQSRTLTTAEIWSYWLRPDGVRSSIAPLESDLSTNANRRDVRNALSGNVDALVTELSLDAQDSEADIDVFLDRVEQTRPNPSCNVIHLTEYDQRPFAESGFISKTIADWGLYLVARGFSDHWILNTRGEYQRADGATI